MPEQNQGEQLDRFVDAVIASPRAPVPNTDAELASLARVAADLRGLPREDFKERLKADLIRRASSMASGTAAASEKSGAVAQRETAKESVSLPSGYPTITPYLIVRRASDFIEFLKAAFGGAERFRFPIQGRPNLIMHAEVAVGNSIIELADASEQYPPAPQTLHLYVPQEVDTVYARAVAAGATAVHAPQDQPWGDRMGALRDAFGNVWYVAMPKGWTPGPEGLRSIQPYLHLRDASKMIAFLEDAFGAEAQGVAKSPEGKVLHATIQIGDWSLEVDDAHANLEPMPCHLHLHVSDADAMYARAMKAGATSIEAPSDKPYGRSGGVRDAFGNSWYITTPPATKPAHAQPQPEARLEEGRPSADIVTEESAVAAVTPYLCVSDAAAALDFYKKAFGAVETLRLNGPGPKVGHAQIQIGKALVMLSDEFPDFGALSPESIGGSPVRLHLNVPDVDAFVARAVAAGAKLVRPVRDEFYGHRTGTVRDPFGYSWSIATPKEEVSAEEMQRRIDAMTPPEEKKRPVGKPAANPVPRGFRTVQPYLIAADGPALLDFVREVFDAEETCRLTGRTGGVHGEMRIGDTMLMMGGGIPGKAFEGKLKQSALHVYVPDTDAVYAKALAAGATSIGEPQDHEYGERGAGVKDAAGNYWYIATHKGESYVPEGLHSVNAYMHPLRAEPMIRFLRQAFGAKEIAKYASPDGVVHHAQVQLGDAVLEMGEAHGPYQPMESMFYLYVPDADGVYQRALAAGAKTLQVPTDQPYGDRNAAVTDMFGNTWYIGTHVRDVQS
jgi:PhnB protein